MASDHDAVVSGHGERKASLAAGAADEVKTAARVADSLLCANASSLISCAWRVGCQALKGLVVDLRLAQVGSKGVGSNRSGRLRRLGGNDGWDDRVGLAWGSGKDGRGRGFGYGACLRLECCKGKS